MNKNRIGFIYPILGTFACIFLCSILWDLIKFNYSNPFDIIGEYSEYSHSIYNDSARYLVFILLPTITFFAIFYTVNKNNFYFSLNFKNIFLKNNTKKNQDLSLRLFIFFLVIIFIFFLIDDWNIQNQYLDIFEEGLSLSGATNSYFGKKAWADIYINTGLFYDILNAKIAWFITGYKSVGAFKFYIKFLNFISNLLLIYLLFNLSKQITEQKIRSIFFFTNRNDCFIYKFK